jgi:hypothetical protein
LLTAAEPLHSGGFFHGIAITVVARIAALAHPCSRWGVGGSLPTARLGYPRCTSVIFWDW